MQFLQDEVDGYYEASSEEHQLFYNTADMQLTYSSASEGEGSVIGGVHLELLVDHLPLPDASNSFWTVGENSNIEGLGMNVILTALTE